MSDGLASGRTAKAPSVQEILALITPGKAPTDPEPASVDVLVVGTGPVRLIVANLLEVGQGRTTALGLRIRLALPGQAGASGTAAPKKHEVGAK